MPPNLQRKHPSGIGPTVLGRYRLVRHLATGGMGEVYLAEAQGAAGFAKRMVVKTLRADLAADGQLAQQLIAEGRLLEVLDHPNIAQILDIGQDGDTFWLAMEYVDGFDLRALLRALPSKGAQFGQLSEAAVLYIVACVARALDHAQTRVGPDGQPLQVVHHDVSPSNVMVRRDGHVKLVDFGVAKAALLGKMAASALRGKLPYLSPEHALQRPVDGRSDLFALGLVAWEMLMGERAQEVTEPGQLARAHEALPNKIAQLRGASGVSQATADLVGQMLAHNPADRPPDAGAVAERAERALVGMGEGSPAKRLAEELQATFDRVAARVGSFDATLAGILGLADSAPSGDRTGTLSLPGLEVVSVAAASAKDEPPVAARRWRKRWITLGMALAAAAIGLGFWFGKLANPIAAPLHAEPAPPASPPAAAESAAQPPLATQPVVVVGPSAAPTAVAAVEVPSEVSEVAVVDSAAGHAQAKPKAKDKQERSAVLRFRVRPFGCQVSVDGEARKSVGDSDRYEVKVTPGDHRITVIDPSNGQRKVVRVSDVGDGEERTLPGGICIGADCPEGP